MEYARRPNLCKTSQAHSRQNWLIFQAATPSGTYGLRYFDKPVDYDEEEDEGEEYEERSCGASCCDKDCECDDCLRCSDTGLKDIDSYPENAVAA